MRFDMKECIRKTKVGLPLTAEQIRGLVRGVTAKDPAEAIPDYQLAAWLMAVCIMGLDDAETAELTAAMRDSGEVMHWDMLNGPVCDKHSTGGVGDKTTLVLAPIAAACGVFMPKMSGRGLGHTGGTIDKLESIPGLTTALAPDDFLAVVQRAGFAVAMQTGDLAPADKVLYALRDVTETVDSIPLICASIMSKKLATGADHILLDVKVGSGAFMKKDSYAEELARLMLIAARADGRDCTAVLTDMDRPLGMNIGNALEVREAIAVLKNGGDPELREFCVDMAAELLTMAGRGDAKACLEMAWRAVESGAALERLRMMVEGQHGDPHIIDDLSLLPAARCERVARAKRSGYVSGMDSEQIGRASVLLGAGRLRKGDPIDPGAGIVLHAKYGSALQPGDPLMTLYAADEAMLDLAEQSLGTAVTLAEEQPPVQPLIRAKFNGRESADPNGDHNGRN